MELGGFGFAGFYSKDMIIEEAFMMGQEGLFFGMPAFWIGVVAALLTSFYSWRLIFMTFHGSFRGKQDDYDHAHDSNWVMTGPLVLLAIGAVFAGAFFKDSFVGKDAFNFWGDALPAGPYAEGNYPEYADGYPGTSEYADVAHATDDHAAPASDDHATDTHADAGHGEAVADAGHGDEEHHGGHHPPAWVLWAPFIVTWTGFFAAIWFYLVKEGMGARIAARGGPLHSFLSNKWYFDEIYNFVFVRGAKGLGDLFWKIGDVRIIDGWGPNGVAGTTLAFAKRMAKAQSGYLYHYAFVMLIGVVGLLLWAQVSAGGQ